MLLISAVSTISHDLIIIERCWLVDLDVAITTKTTKDTT